MGSIFPKAGGDLQGHEVDARLVLEDLISQIFDLVELEDQKAAGDVDLLRGKLEYLFLAPHLKPFEPAVAEPGSDLRHQARAALHLI